MGAPPGVDVARGPAAPGTRRGACVAAVVAFGVWAAVSAGPYHFDDFEVPLHDPASASLSALAAHATTTLRPLTKLTFAAEASAGVRDAAARRVVSAALHGAAAGALCLLLAALVEGAAPWTCVAAALLWALHPVHAESVLAVAGRSAALSNLLLLAALLAAAKRRPGLAVAGLVAAGLARETALAGVLPLGVLLAGPRGARAPRDTLRAAARAAARRGAGAAVAALALALALCAVPRYRELAAFSFGEAPFAASVARQLAAVPAGLVLYVDTGALSVDHGPVLAARVSDPRALLGALLLVSAAAVALRWHTLRPGVACGLALWCGALLPTQTVIPRLDPLTERPLGLALAGLVTAGFAARAAWAPRADAPCRGRRLAGMPAGAGVCACVALLVASAAATLQRGRLYASDVALWRDAAAKSRTNVRPHVNYGAALARAGRVREAAAAFRAALAIDPNDRAAATGAAAMEDRIADVERAGATPGRGDHGRERAR